MSLWSARPWAGALANHHTPPKLPRSENLDRSHLDVGPIVYGSGQFSCSIVDMLENSRERPDGLTGTMGTLICWIRDIRPQDHRSAAAHIPARPRPAQAVGLLGTEDLLGGEQLPGEPQGPDLQAPPTRNYLDQTTPTTSPRRPDVRPLSRAAGKKKRTMPRWLRTARFLVPCLGVIVRLPDARRNKAVVAFASSVVQQQRWNPRQA